MGTHGLAHGLWPFFVAAAGAAGFTVTGSGSRERRDASSLESRRGRGGGEWTGGKSGLHGTAGGLRPKSRSRGGRDPCVLLYPGATGCQGGRLLVGAGILDTAPGAASWVRRTRWPGQLHRRKPPSFSAARHLVDRAPPRGSIRRVRGLECLVGSCDTKSLSPKQTDRPLGTGGAGTGDRQARGHELVGSEVPPRKSHQERALPRPVGSATRGRKPSVR